MYTYFELTLLLIVGVTNLLFFITSLKDTPVIAIFCLIGAGVSLFPTFSLIVNPAASPDNVSKLVIACPDVRKKIEARTEPLLIYQATQLYNECIEDRDASKSATLEMQKKAAGKKD